MKYIDNLKKYVVVIPAHNEASRIGKILRKLKECTLSVIVVDDGSVDNTDIVLKKSKEILSIRHKINLGKGAAMKTGCDLAFKNGADAVIFMDADGQHNVADIDKFIKALDRGYDVMFGSRNLSYGVPFVRYLGNKFGSVVISLLFGIYISDLLCGFRAITKGAYKRIKWESNRYGVETEMTIRTAKEKLRYCEVPVETIYLDGVKGVTLFDAVNIFLDVVRWKFTI